MADLFSISLLELAERTGARLMGDPDCRLFDIAPLEEAENGSVSFLGNPRYTKAAAKTRASAVFVSAELEATLPTACARLVVDHPSAAFQVAVELFVGQRRISSGFTGIHPTAVVHPTVQLAAGVTIQPYAVLDAEVSIGEGTVIGPHVSIGPGVSIGSRCYLHAHSVVREGVRLGDRVILQPGAVLGSCGFGYHTDPSTGCHRKLDQIGVVVVEEDVEIGANTTIDRARFQATRIGAGTKVDNLVQIAHNASLGRDNLIVAQVGLAGSCSTGDRCILGGQAAIVGHVAIGDDVTLTARAAATKNFTKGVYSGAPAIPHHDHARQQVLERQLPKWVERIKSMEEQLDAAPSCTP